MARTLRKLGRREEALQAYPQLRAIPDAAAGGAPAPLAGQWAICTMHEEAGRAAQVMKEGQAHIPVCHVIVVCRPGAPRGIPVPGAGDGGRHIDYVSCRGQTETWALENFLPKSAK